MDPRGGRADAPDEHAKDALAIHHEKGLTPATAEDLSGRWELVFSTAAAKLPLIDGYMPNRELLSWDLGAGRLNLQIETLTFLPTIAVLDSLSTMFYDGRYDMRHMVRVFTNCSF